MAEFFDNMVSFEKELNTLTVALRILMAIIFGGIIGIERDRHGSQAGMRTHIFVCLGGTLTSLMGVYCTKVLGFDSDPLRIAAQVVSGIGFLGAGMIIVKSHAMITGLTTAAIMWTTAIIGIGLGIGFYSGALIALLVCIFTAAFLTRIERRRKKSVSLYMEVDDLKALEDITEGIKALLPSDAFMEVTSPKSGTVGHMGISVISTGLDDVDALKKNIKAMNGIYFVIVE
ncbi:MAG: MgtC/SapB family protein [Clostridia bacterium]|nr:MgtC/SapB family protein [Clostridia bacterium]